MNKANTSVNLTEIVKAADIDFSVMKPSTGAMTRTHQTAVQEFIKSGFPTIKHEEWKYTNLKKISAMEFAQNAGSTGAVNVLLAESISPSVKANRLVFVNGIYRDELSTILDDLTKVQITTIQDVASKDNAAFELHFGRYAVIDNSSLNGLNAANISDGVFIEVPDHTKLLYPVSIIHLIDSTHTNVLSQPRNLIVVGKHASITLIESYYAIGVNSSFVNCVNEVYADEHSVIEYYKIQREAGESYQNNYTQIFQEKDTQINHVTLTLDGKMVRNNLHFYMNGERCNSLLYGLYITDGTQHVDNHTRVDHAKPNCFSDEKYKGILKDKSVAVFNGKIMVHLDAQKTNAYQRNQNILLSDEATVNTKPQLEIFADDVKCTHGATIGQLDEEPMFYLRSRGISEDAARKMLLTAFADDIAEKIKIPEMVALMEERINSKL